MIATITTVWSIIQHVLWAPFAVVAGGLVAADDVPARSYEELILEILHATDPVRLDVLIDHAVDAAIHDEIRRGCWTLDVGIWGPSLIRSHVVQTVRAMLGRTLVLEAEGGESCVAVPFFAR